MCTRTTPRSASSGMGATRSSPGHVNEARTTRRGTKTNSAALVDSPRQRGPGHWGTNVLSWLEPSADRRVLLRFENLVDEPRESVSDAMSRVLPGLTPARRGDPVIRRAPRDRRSLLPSGRDGHAPRRAPGRAARGVLGTIRQRESHEPPRVQAPRLAGDRNHLTAVAVIVVLPCTPVCHRASGSDSERPPDTQGGRSTRSAEREGSGPRPTKASVLPSAHEQWHAIPPRRSRLRSTTRHA